MASQALYLKWRPRTFDDVIGQEHITRTLRSALTQNRIRHAYLFNGPRGTGKTTMARLLAKAVNCQHPVAEVRPCDECRFCTLFNEGRFLDLIEIDAASHNGVDDVRDLRDKIAFAPTEGQYKVYIVDEVHRFSPAAFDALLKTLEEPPDHAIFVLATTERDKVPDTIKSRSQVFDFRRVSTTAVADRLELIAREENVEIDREVLELVAQQGTGSVRDSISLLDQLIANPETPITLDYAERVLGTSGTRLVRQMVEAIINQDAASGLELLNRAIDDGADPAQFGRQIVSYLRDVLLTQTGGASLVEASDDQRAALTHQASSIGRGALLHAVKAFNSALNELRGGWQPQLPLELALIECTRPVKGPLDADLADEPDDEPVRAEPARGRGGSRAGGRAKGQGQAPSAETSEPTPSGETADGPVRIGDVRKAWPAILEHLNNNNKPLATLLKQVALYGVEGQVLVLTAEHDWMIDRLGADDKRRALTEAIQRVLKVRLGIKVVATKQAAQSKANDTIIDDPLIADQLRSGAKLEE